jgi:hypothetical protein
MREQSKAYRADQYAAYARRSLEKKEPDVKGLAGTQDRA